MFARRMMMAQQYASTAALVGSKRCNMYGLQAAQTMRAASIMNNNPFRMFSSEGVGIADAPDVFKVNYTEEFD